MKFNYARLLSTMILAAVFSVAANAQYDDIYFDPDQAQEVYAAVDDAKLVRDYGTDKRVTRASDDYDYYYTSRIRRFESPYYGFDFYSPIYVDPYYYNRYYSNFYYPGANIYAGSAYGYPAGYASSYAVWNSPAYGFGNPGIYPGTGFSTGGFYGGLGSAGPGFGGGFYGGGVAGGVAGGYNPYCPPASYGVYNGGSILANGGGTAPTGTRGTQTSGTYYGPRGTGSVNASPRQPGNGNSGSTAPDRPLTSAGSPVTTRPDAANPTTYSPRESTVNGPRKPSYAPTNTRRVYTPPASASSRTLNRTSSAAERFTAPSRPTSRNYYPTSGSSSGARTGYPASRSYSPATRSSSSSPRSSSMGSSSPRSSSGMSRSSGSSGGSRSPR